MKKFLLLMLLNLVFYNHTQIYSQWQYCYSNDFLSSFGVIDGNLFAGTYMNGVQLSTDDGISWIAANNGLPNQKDVTALGFLGTNIIAGTEGAGVYRSTDNGTSWTDITSNLPSKYIKAFVSIGTKLFVGTLGGIFLTTDNGSNWTAMDSGLTNTTVTSFAISDTNLFAGTWNGVFLSTDEGQNWTHVNNGLTSSLVNALIFLGPNLVAGTSNGVFISTNNGTNWSPISSGLTNKVIRCLASHGTNLFAGTNGGGVFLTNNNGISWTKVGLDYIYALAIVNQYLFAGIGMGIAPGIHRRLLSQMITSIDQLVNQPSDFILLQNYPNPFNPSTKISWQSPSGSKQTIKVFDVLGNEISTLVNEYRPAGTYEVDFNATNISSGAYFYRLQAGDFIQTRKMILLK